jgi:ornithine racemase
MAFVTLDSKKLKSNFTFLNDLFTKNGIQWAVVSKLLCGNVTFMTELLDLGITQVCDSRVSNLKVIKSINPLIETI